MNEGRQLMAKSDTPSYAAELEVLSKDEVCKIRSKKNFAARLSRKLLFTCVNLPVPVDEQIKRSTIDQ